MSNTDSTQGNEPSLSPIAPNALQARLAAIVESSDDAIVSKTLEGIITSWNTGAERIFGYTAAEAIGQPMTLIIPLDRQDEEPRILARIRAGDRVDHFETIRRRKDGNLIEVSVTISPVRDDRGIIVGASKIARDITSQKRIERELIEARQIAEAARETAEAASRAKDHFLSVLSHELRTPLTPVLAALSLLEASPSTPNEARDQLQMIRRNVETEARLVDDLLDLTRIARGKVSLHLEVVDAHALLRAVLAMVQMDIDDKDISVTVALRAKQPHIWADPGRFQQMLLNLLSNAVKFTPTGGSITLRSHDAEGQLVLQIIDSGVGIEPEVLPRLFTPFEQGEKTVTRQYGGLGLGLSIVRSLADLHKATVTATSAGKDQGTILTLSIPAVPASTTAPQSPGDTDRARATGLRVLLVEDHADTRAVLVRLLRSFGCTVTAAGSVKEALALVDANNLDLLISDIGLPDGTGLDVMRHAQDKLHIPGIALSGFGQDEDLARSRAAGFATHLTKPVSLNTLQDTIARYAVHSS